MNIRQQKKVFFICNSSNDISNFDSEKIKMSYFADDDLSHFFSKRSKLHMPKIGVSSNLSLFVVPDVVCNIKSQYTGLEITADQRSMSGRKLFLIGEETTLPFILIGKQYV